MARRAPLSPALPRCIVVRGWHTDHAPRTWHHRRTLTAERSIQRLVASLGEAGGVALAERVAAARARWPQVPAINDALVDYLVARIGRLADRDQAPVEDLVLAWWAGTGDSAGIAAFEASFARDIAALAARFAELAADDLRQRLRIKLFVGTGERPAKIHDYLGSGPLGGWLRVTAARTFVDAARADLRRRTEVELEQADVLGLAPPAGSPHDAPARAALSAAIKAAFADAVARLTSRERSLLRLATVDGLTLEQIAATYRIHRATVARILKSSRERLLGDTRAGVVARLGIEPAQLTSALAVLDSKLDLSLSHVLRPSSTVEG